MAILKTEAVVLKGWRLGETSKILSLFSRDHGKIKVVAKGALGPKSKFKGCIECLAHIGVIYYNKQTRELQLLSQADLKDGHIHILGDFERTSLALAASELIDKAVLAEEPMPSVFDLFVHYLQMMDRGDGILEGYFWFFESRFIDIMGYQPTWDHCLDCNGSLGAAGGFFQPMNGGLLCHDCGSKRGGLKIEGETLEILYWLQRAVLEEAGKLNPLPAQKAEIRKMFDLYFKTHIEHMRSLKSLRIYYQMENS
jgi:DNA repair protein RecO (recombination protein O)